FALAVQRGGDLAPHPHPGAVFRARRNHRRLSHPDPVAPQPSAARTTRAGAMPTLWLRDGRHLSPLPRLRTESTAAHVSIAAYFPVLRSATATSSASLSIASA